MVDGTEFLQALAVHKGVNRLASLIGDMMSYRSNPAFWDKALDGLLGADSASFMQSQADQRFQALVEVLEEGPECTCGGPHLQC